MSLLLSGGHSEFDIPRLGCTPEISENGKIGSVTFGIQLQPH